MTISKEKLATGDADRKVDKISQEEVATALWIAQVMLETKGRLAKIKGLEGLLGAAFAVSWMGTTLYPSQETPSIIDMALALIMLLSGMGVLGTAMQHMKQKGGEAEKLRIEIGRMIGGDPIDLETIKSELDGIQIGLFETVKILLQTLKGKMDAGKELLLPAKYASSYSEVGPSTIDYWILLLQRLRRNMKS